MSWLGTWAKRFKITVDDTNIDSDLTHFPIPIMISATSGQSDDDLTVIFDDLGANKLKIAVTKSDGTTQLYAEVEKWDNAGESAVLWVSKSDLVIDADDGATLYLYFDPLQDDNSDYVAVVGSRTEVWKAAFLGVYHMAEASGNLVDSTSNNHDSTSSGGTPGYGATGVLGNAIDFEATDSEYFLIPDTAIGKPAIYTVQYWCKPESWGNACVACSCDTGGAGDHIWGIVHRDTGDYVEVWVSNGTSGDYSTKDIWDSTDMPSASFHLIHGVAQGNGSNLVLYKNGASVDSEAQGVANSGTAKDFAIGRLGEYAGFYYDGIADEVRVANADLGAAWIKADYYAMTDNLLEFWAVETSHTGGWEVETAGTGTVESDAAIVHCGLASAKITADADHGANPTYLSQDVTVVEGYKYVLTGSVYGDGKVTITCDVATDTTTETGADWDDFSLDLVADDTTLTIKLEPTDDSDVAYFDCLELTAYYPSGYEHTKFIGTLQRIYPSSGLFDDPMTECEAHDWIGYLNKQELGIQAILANKTVDEALDVLMDEFPNQPEDEDFDTGVETFELVFAGDSSTSSMASMLSKLCRNEQGRIYTKGDGTLVFEKQGGRALNTTPAFVLDGTMENIEVVYNVSNIYNIVSLDMRTTETDAAATTQLFNVGKGILIAAGETLNMVCNYTDPDTGQKVAGADVVDPETADTFNFGTTRTPANDDKHADIVWPTSPVIGGSSVSISMKNDSAVNGYLNELKILGKRITEYDSITIEKRDEDSIFQVGNRRYSNRMDLIEDAATVEDIAQGILDKFAPSHVDSCRVTVLANIDDDLAVQLILAEPSTRFTAIETVTGIERDFYINRIGYRQDDTLLWVTIEAEGA